MCSLLELRVECKKAAMRKLFTAYSIDWRIESDLIRGSEMRCTKNREKYAHLIPRMAIK